MSDNTPITKGLRSYLYDAMVEIPSCLKRALSFCDSIDAIHKAMEQKSADMLDFCERVEQAAQARKDVSLWGVDYMALPLDADGVPIRVGDAVDCTKGLSNLIVLGVGRALSYGDELGVFVLERGEFVWYNAGFLRHHHAPTVADVLREFADVIHKDIMSDSPSDCDATIERFAKRLQLAEVDE